MKIVLEHLTKQFPARGRKSRESVTAVDNFNFEIPDGQLIGLLGPSGCGKSTTLNMICGLEKPTDGRILFGEEDVTNLPPENRGVGMVFQNYALYPHMTVEQNIAFPLVNQKVKKEKIRECTEEMAKLVQIGDLLKRKPSQLSGGQQQRVSIGRALMNAPAVVLADEPTGNLDSKNSKEIVDLLKISNEKYGQTLIVITHDESIALQADRIISIDDGKITRDEVIRR